MLTEAFVYIMSSHSRCIYIGFTRNMMRRWLAHREGRGSLFVRKYRIRRLVHVERFALLTDALKREKQLKGWRRSKKVALIEETNPAWRDLGIEWGWRPPAASAGPFPRPEQARVARAVDGPPKSCPGGPRRELVE